MIYLEGDFPGIVAELHHKLMDAPHVDTGHWQGLKNVPHTATRELRNVTFETSMPQSQEEALWFYDPNMPWAEDHFQERVSGYPRNPGNQYMNWPWYRGGVEDHKKTGLFSHSYMERLWPKYAGEGVSTIVPQRGVRYPLGDLNDVVSLLAREPHTRQAWLPIWFPEDTGAAGEPNQRLPCSLGYQFQLRNDKLHVNYVMRSTDFLRYLRDDTYMGVRLGQWVMEQLVPRLVDGPVDGRDLNAAHPWATATMGTFSFTTFSLHVFEGDMSKMRREAPERP